MMRSGTVRGSSKGILPGSSSPSPAPKEVPTVNPSLASAGSAGSGSFYASRRRFSSSPSAARGSSPAKPASADGVFGERRMEKVAEEGKSGIMGDFSGEAGDLSGLIKRMQEDKKPPKQMGWLFQMIKRTESGFAQGHAVSSDLTQGSRTKFSPEVFKWIDNKIGSGYGGSTSFKVKTNRPKRQKFVVGLKDTLENPEWSKTLESFLEENGYDQVLNFLEDVNDFRRVRSEKTKQAAAKGIFDRFIDRSSARKVAIPNEVFEEIKSRLEKDQITDNMFDEAYDIVHDRLENGDFRRFSQTAVFMEMLPPEVFDRVNAEEELRHAPWTNEEKFQSVHVDIISADGLIAKDASGRADPFVEVSVGSKTYRTKVEKASLHPNWEEHFELPVSSTSLFVKVAVYDKDLIGSKDFMGQAIIYMADINPPYLPDWYPLMEDPKGEHEQVGGDIHLRIKFSKNPAEESKDALVVDPPSTSAFSELVRGKVSKKKIRFVEDGFNLDLAYVTDHIIAMGFPSENFEGFYRNNIKDVQRFFAKRHPDHYMIYNLCSEREYPGDKFDGRVVRYGFDDHNPCPFSLIEVLCLDVDSFLKEHPQNVVSIHCKAGKGRTGLIISCYLIYAYPDEFKTSEEALTYFASKRTKNKKGVTIPSQMRYVKYWEWYLRATRGLPSGPPIYKIPERRVMLLRSVTLFCPPIGKSASSVVFKLIMPGIMSFNQKSSSVSGEVGKEGDEEVVKWIFGAEPVVPLTDDVKVIFSLASFLRSEKLFHFWINTRFIQNKVVELKKNEIDKAVKDSKHKLYKAGLRVRIEFDIVPDQDLDYKAGMKETFKSLIGPGSMKPYDFEDTTVAEVTQSPPTTLESPPGATASSKAPAKGRGRAASLSSFSRSQSSSVVEEKSLSGKGGPITLGAVAASKTIMEDEDNRDTDDDADLASPDLGSPDPESKSLEGMSPRSKKS